MVIRKMILYGTCRNVPHSSYYSSPLGMSFDTADGIIQQFTRAFKTKDKFIELELMNI